jgi:hypothetical protein
LLSQLHRYTCQTIFFKKTILGVHLLINQTIEMIQLNQYYQLKKLNQQHQFHHLNNHQCHQLHQLKMGHILIIELLVHLLILLPIQSLDVYTNSMMLLILLIEMMILIELMDKLFVWV